MQRSDPMKEPTFKDYLMLARMFGTWLLLAPIGIFIYAAALWQKPRAPLR